MGKRNRGRERNSTKAKNDKADEESNMCVIYSRVSLLNLTSWTTRETPDTPSTTDDRHVTR